MIHNLEEFSDEQIKILEKYVTDVSGNVFVLQNLPEVIKGALFSRYSRSTLGLRALLLKEFILNEETSFDSITGNRNEKDFSVEEQGLAIQKAQNFYDRILDGFGDDSIGELGGTHLAIENISMIGAKIIEDCRVGGSPLEKSTRYIYFDQKIDGEYLFYKEPIIMTSAYRDIYLDTCNMLFDTYSKLIPKLTNVIQEKFPTEHNASKAAYTSALRAKVLDCLRGLLPSSALTNIGIFGNGRFYEYMLSKLNCHNLAELQELGKSSFTELAKIIPSFIRRSDINHRNQKAFSEFSEQMKTDLKLISENHIANIREEREPGVALIGYDKDAVYNVAGALLFANTHANLSDLQKYCKSLPDEEIARILDAGCLSRENRRHKSPRALEHATFTFEIVADFGAYRDLQRHRILTQERQLLTCDYGYYMPVEILDTEMEKDYINAMEAAKSAYETISKELPEEAQYVVPMAYNMHWYFHVNLRSLQWLCELRSSPAGHPNYRYIAQEIARQVCTVFPQFERFFKFVDFEGYELGRIEQENKRIEKRSVLEHERR
jgi:thymidylate synthase ThyX